MTTAVLYRTWKIIQTTTVVLIFLFAAYGLSLAMDPLFDYITSVLNR